MKQAVSRTGWPGRDWMFLLALVLAFVGSRAVVYSLGVHSSEELPRMHLLDRDLLSDDLGRSLFFLHTQPPLFNGFVGLLLKVPGERLAPAASAAYWMLGLALTVLLYRLMRRLMVPPWGAALATLTLILGPACLLYETYTLYTYPVAVLVVGVSYAAHRYFTSGAWQDALLLAGLVTAVALMRSLFHLIWVLAMIGLVLTLRRPTRRRTLAILLVPVILVGLLYLKNAWHFGMFGPSSLLGLNLYRITTEILPIEERLSMAETGMVSPYALYPVNQPIGHYPRDRGLVGRIDPSSHEARGLLPVGWWRKAESSPEGESLWSIGPRSVLVLPGAGPGSYRLNFRCAPFRFPGASRQTIRVRVNGRNLATLALEEAVSEYSLEIPAGALTASLNLVVFHYGYNTAPRQVGVGDDGRRLAVRWFELGIDPPLGLPVAGSPRTGDQRVTPVLQREMKKDGGPNLNHERLPEIMLHYQRDALRVIRHSPGVYFRAVARAGLIFLAPPMEHPTFRRKRKLIGVWDRLYSRWFYGAAPSHWPGEHSHRSRWRPTRELLGRVSWLSLALALFFLPMAAVRALGNPRDPVHTTILLSLLTLIFVTVFANLLEYGENNRFRMMIEPLAWVIVVATASRWISALPRPWRRKARLATEKDAASPPEI